MSDYKEQCWKRYMENKKYERYDKEDLVDEIIEIKGELETVKDNFDFNLGAIENIRKENHKLEQEIERLNKERNKLYENGLNDFLELQKKRVENERLNNIIKEVRELLSKYNDKESNYYVPVNIVLEILDKEKDNE